MDQCQVTGALIDVYHHRFSTYLTVVLFFQLAYDESYLDPTNLRSKLQKHLAFDSELTENEKRLVAVEAQGEQLIKEKHFMSEQVC